MSRQYLLELTAKARSMAADRKRNIQKLISVKFDYIVPYDKVRRKE
jgi:hypothetical protein